VRFGKPIGAFQLIAFKFTDLAIEIEHAKQLFYKAHWLCKNHRSFSKEKAMAKVFYSEIHRVVNQAVKIHGVYDLMKEYPIERRYRNLKILDIVEGTSEIQRIVISRLTGDQRS